MTPILDDSATSFLGRPASWSSCPIFWPQILWIRPPLRPLLGLIWRPEPAQEGLEGLPCTPKIDPVSILHYRNRICQYQTRCCSTKIDSVVPSSPLQYRNRLRSTQMDSVVPTWRQAHAYDSRCMNKRSWEYLSARLHVM